MVIKNYENKAIKLKLNAPLRDLRNGSIVTVRTDENGTPLDRYWRNRLKDAELDDCVEIIDKSGTAPEKKGGKK
jgi:hypothetical protein